MPGPTSSLWPGLAADVQPYDAVKIVCGRLMEKYGVGSLKASRLLRSALAQAEDEGHQLDYRQAQEILGKTATAALGHALLDAARKGDAAQIESLLLETAPVNFQDPATGMTALHYAAAFAARPSFRALMASGKCDVLIRDSNQRLPWELASMAGDPVIARLLLYKARQQAGDESHRSKRRPGKFDGLTVH